jgi:hypothetical protein
MRNSKKKLQVTHAVALNSTMRATCAVALLSLALCWEQSASHPSLLECGTDATTRLIPGRSTVRSARPVLTSPRPSLPPSDTDQKHMHIHPGHTHDCTSPLND